MPKRYSKMAPWFLDFLFAESPEACMCNAPSPAATSAMPIGEYVAKVMENVLIAMQMDCTASCASGY